MPTIFILNGFRFFFYSGDKAEPIHVHVEKGNATAKFWVSPVRLERSNGFSRKDLSKIHDIINEKKTVIKRRWNEFFHD